MPYRQRLSLMAICTLAIRLTPRPAQIGQDWRRLPHIGQDWRRLPHIGPDWAHIGADRTKIMPAVLRAEHLQGTLVPALRLAAILDAFFRAPLCFYFYISLFLIYFYAGDKHDASPLLAQYQYCAICLPEALFFTAFACHYCCFRVPV